MTQPGPPTPWPTQPTPPPAAAPPRTRRPRTWMVTAIGAVVAAGTALAATAIIDGVRDSDTPGPASTSTASRADNEATATAIEDEVAALPGVAFVDITYVQDPSTTGSVTVRVQVATANDLPPVTDEIVRALWESTIDPMATITLSPTIDDAAAADQPQPEVLNLRRGDGDALEQQYGPRP